MGRKTSKIALIAAISTIWPTFASSQQGGVGTTSTVVPQTATATSSTATTATVPSTTATAAAAPGGVQIDIGITSSLKTDSNFQLTPGGSGSSQFFENKLSFGISSVTSNYSLNILASGNLRYAEFPGINSSGFEDPTLRVAYTADSANSSLKFNGRYRNVDRNFLNPFDVEREQQTLGQLVGDGGTLRDTFLGLSYETGIRDPIGFRVDLSYDDKQYSGVVNPLIFDNRTDIAKATVFLRPSKVTTLFASAAIDHYTATDSVQTSRDTIDYALGVTQDINSVLVLDAQIGYSDIETTTLGGVTDQSGLVGSVGLTKTLTNGTVFGTLGSTRNQNGKRVDLSFGRALALRNGNLSAAIGLTKGDTGSTNTTAALSYTHQLLRDDFRVSVNRGASTNGLNQDIIDTRIGLGYGHLIDNVSRLDLTFDWGRTEDTGSTGANTIDLYDLSAVYTRSITPDWNLSGGVTLRKQEETGRQTADSTSLFVTLGRNFSFRP